TRQSPAGRTADSPAGGCRVAALLAMTATMLVLTALACLAWLYLGLGHGRFWQSGPELPPARAISTPAPAVAVVVPARDEAPVIAATLRSLLAQDYAGPVRIILG